MFEFLLTVIKLSLITTPISVAMNKINDTLIEQRNLNDGNITKIRKITKGKLIRRLVVVSIPFLNIIMSGVLGSIITMVLLKNDQLFKKVMQDIAYSPDYVKYSYEKRTQEEKNIADAMKLDGANKTIIKEELKQIKKLNNGFAEKSKHGFLFDSPTFTEKDYNIAKALMQANQFLFEIECSTKLSTKEKRELLANLRKVYLAEIKGKDKPDMQPIRKLEKKLSGRTI